VGKKAVPEVVREVMVGGSEVEMRRFLLVLTDFSAGLDL
jgi:hypothetical protein